MSAADISETTLERPKGPPLFFRKHLVEKEQARMVIVHGLGEHSGRYLALAEDLAKKGISLWILDLRGHGQSGGEKGHVESFDDYTDDVRCVVDLALEGKPADTKFFLLGHSMGGLVAIGFALEHQDLIEGLVVSSPALGVAAPIPAVKKVAAALAARILPRLGIKNELDPQHVSRDPEIVRQYIEDPLVHNRVSTNFYIQFLKAVKTAFLRAADIKIPILIQIAGADRIVNAQDVVAFFEALTVPDRELKVYDGLYHEIYNETEPDRTRVISELSAWLSQKIGV